jgi:hypothetical protein
LKAVEALPEQRAQALLPGLTEDEPDAPEGDSVRV